MTEVSLAESSIPAGGASVSERNKEVVRRLVDEVLNAYESTGSTLDEERRREARAVVMRNVLSLDEMIGTAAEDGRLDTELRAGPLANRPGDASPERRDMALAAIEDLLIDEGFIEPAEGESRVFPVRTVRDTDRSD